ncbi:hypothetical protein Tco_0741980 [Tanacetum coccineum]
MASSSSSGPRCQDTILGDGEAQTRFETAYKQSNDPPLSRVNTLGSEEDRLKLKKLIDLCIKLSDRVLDLETTKTAQANEIASLKKRVISAAVDKVPTGDAVNTASTEVNTASTPVTTAGVSVRGCLDHPLKNIVDRGIFDSGCSGHMTGNKDQLEDFEEFNRGYVTFGGSKGYITGHSQHFTS